jgi:hypothetical protein
MATWKKWIIRTVATFVILACVLLSFLVIALDRLADNMCGTSIFDSIASPDGKTRAVLFEIDCGATTGFNRQVSIVSSGTDLKKDNPVLPRSFFAARGKPEVRLIWLGKDRLEVQYPESIETFRIEQKSKGVAIEYKQTR